METSGLEHSTLELVKIRASQINGCAYCLDMHTKDARALGETEQRIYALSAWRETPFFSDRERAALEWTEAVTRVSVDHVPDAVYTRWRRTYRSGARGADVRDRDDQQLEPAVDFVPRPARVVPVAARGSLVGL